MPGVVALVIWEVGRMDAILGFRLGYVRMQGVVALVIGEVGRMDAILGFRLGYVGNWLATIWASRDWENGK